jgi:hypothetical protein
MAHEHCPKHDITYPQGGQCWCCEEQELHKTGKHAAAYRDPHFLLKRGGAPIHQTTVNAAVARLSQLSDEQLERLMALASGAPPVASPQRRVIAVG